MVLRNWLASKANIVGVFLLVILVAGAFIGAVNLDLGLKGKTTNGQATQTITQGALSPTQMETSQSTPTKTTVSAPTQTLTPTQRATTTPTRTPTVTPTPSVIDEYGNFLVEMRGGLNQSIRTPLRIRGATIQEDVLYIVHNATSANVNTTKKFVEWGDIAIGYAGAIRDAKKFYNDSEIPSRMVVFETNSSNLIPEKPAKFVVTTENANEWNRENITGREFTKRWQDTLQRQEQRDVEFATVIDRQKPNATYYPEKPVKVEDE